MKILKFSADNTSVQKNETDINGFAVMNEQATELHIYHIWAK